MLNRISRYFTTIILLLTVPTAFAAGSGGECLPISETPFVISDPGRYCLTMDLKASMPNGKAIWVKSNDVTLDFRHYSLSNALARLGNTAYGVYANGRSNIKVYNGELSGWGTGVRFVGLQTMGNTISDMKFDSIRWKGIDAEGTGLGISNNRFTRIGGSAAMVDAYAIDIQGMSPRVTHNSIFGVMANNGNGSAYGTRLRMTTNPIYEDNTLDTLNGDKIGLGVGLKLDGTVNAIIVNTKYQTCDTAIALENDSTALLKDTLITDCDTTVSGFGAIFVGFNY